MKNFKTSSYLFTALGSALILSSCATSLAHRSPIDIASNSIRNVDNTTGVSEILGPNVKAFKSSRGGISGQARLRTAGPFTDDKGAVITGGAYVDVLINYSTATPNPDEARIYDRVSWAGGQPALLADYGGSVLECREDVRAVPRPYPQSYNYYRYGYGGYGYGYGHGYRGHGHGPGRGGPHGGGGRGGHGDGDGDGRGGHGGGQGGMGGSSTGGMSGTAVIPSVERRRPPRRPSTIPAPQPDGPGTEPSISPPFFGSKPAVSRRRPGLASAKGTAPRPNAPTVSRPAPVSKPAPRSKPKPSPRPERVTRTKPVSKPSVSRTFSRTRNRTTSPRNTSPRREVNYYPRDSYYGSSGIDYVVRRRCDRQEYVRVFVPRERLNASENSGLLLYFRPQAGREEMLVFPPNYISGFKMAAYSPEGRNMTIPGRPSTPQTVSAPAAPHSQPAPTQTTAPAHDPSQPIIYGGN